MSYSSATPWNAACQVPLSMGFPRQEYWSGLPFLSPGDLPDPGTECMSLVPLAWQADSLPLSHLGSPVPSGSFLFCPQWCCPSQGRYVIVFTSLIPCFLITIDVGLTTCLQGNINTVCKRPKKWRLCL